MSLFSALGTVLSGGANKVLKSVGGALGGKDVFTGINPIQDYTGITAAKMQQDIAEKNLELQRNQFDYQQQLNEREWNYQVEQNALTRQREDTAYQRKVADLKAAGLNPVLAAGGSGSAAAGVSVPSLRSANAPQLDSSFTDKYAGAGQALASLVFQAISMKKDFAQKDAMIKLLGAQKQNVMADTDKKAAETANLNIVNQYEEEYLQGRNQGQRIANEVHSFSLEVAKSKLPLELANMSADVALKEKRFALIDLDIELKKLNVTGLELDNIRKALDNSKVFKELSKLDQDIQVNAIAIAMKKAELDEYNYARSFFHERLAGAPVGYTIPHYSSLAYPIIRKAVDEVDHNFYKFIPKPGVSFDYSKFGKR